MFEQKIRLKLADIVTFANIFVGFLAVYFAAPPGRNLGLSAILILICVVLDFLDGKVARMSKIGATDFGKNIDSFSDLVSFGIAPALVFMNYMPEWGVIFAFMVVLAGVFRLARFNIFGSAGGYFTGMPTSVTAIIAAVFQMAGLLNIYTAIGLSIVLSGLMVSKIKIKKI